MPTHRRLAFLDWLRALAILLVFAKHAGEVFVRIGQGNRWLVDLGLRFNLGELGVVIFFCISGFLIPSSLHGAPGPGSARYVISRVFRLYPAYIASVVPSAWAHFWMAHETFALHAVAWNLTMMPRLFGWQLANGAYWTLEVELVFYILCLFLFLGGILRQSFTFAALAAVMFVVFQSSQQPILGGYLNPRLLDSTFRFNLNLSVMCWGAVCRAWWDGRRLNPLTACLFWAYPLIWVIYQPGALLLAELHGQKQPIDGLIVSAYGGGMAIFLAGALYRRLHHRLMLWIGRISYSLYLLHGVVIHAMYNIILRNPRLGGYAINTYAIVALLISLLLAQISFSLIERPGIRLGRMLAARLLPPDADAAHGAVAPPHASGVARLGNALLARPGAIPA